MAPDGVGPLRHTGVQLGRALLDPVRRGLPRRASAVGPAELARLVDSPVGRVTVLDGTSGTTDRARLRVHGGAGLPPTVFVKTSATDLGTRLFGGLARLGEVEVGFYRDVRPGLDLEAPRLLGAQLDRWSGRFVLVLEDLAARGARFVDTLTPLTPDQAAGTLTALARLHGSTTRLPVQPRWLGTNAGDPVLPWVTGSIRSLTRRVERADPTLVARGGPGLLASYGAWAPRLDAGPRVVLHGDCHPGNVYLVDGVVGLLDWQAVRLGHPVRDVTYHLVLGLSTTDRRACERDLLEHYRRELAAAGGPGLTSGEVWESHRLMASYAYLAATFTFGLGGLQDGDVADEGLRRAVAAVDDLGSVDAVR